MIVKKGGGLPKKPARQGMPRSYTLGLLHPFSAYRKGCCESRRLNFHVNAVFVA